MTEPPSFDMARCHIDGCECGSTYFKVHDGEPECVKCGRKLNAGAKTEVTA